jgi:hypothetical protein
VTQTDDHARQRHGVPGLPRAAAVNRKRSREGSFVAHCRKPTFLAALVLGSSGTIRSLVIVHKGLSVCRLGSFPLHLQLIEHRVHYPKKQWRNKPEQIHGY